MYSNEKKTQKIFFYWLFTSLVLVFCIIIVGGLTRLTNSGLSITEWELFRGILPPTNEGAWQFYFDQYKKIPQYKLLNFNMSLDEFKVIFYWEYFHRIIARLIGLFFLIPLIYFYFCKKIKKEYIKICFLIFFLIIIQGLIGWIMVKSGLTNNITVSHYRLSIHLILAILIISLMFWLLKNIKNNKNKVFFKIEMKNIAFQIFIFLIFLQILMGAFVSGLDAGRIYQTWPLMGENLFPNDIVLKNFSTLYEFSNHSLVQFYHRNLAYIIVLYSILLAIIIYKNEFIELYRPIKLLLFIIFTQVILGILTLVSGLNIYLASLHQISSVLLVFSALNLYYFRAK